MLLLNHNEIKAQYGASYPMGGARRFNADDATLHRSPTHVYEFGYQKGFVFYSIIQKRVGGFTAIERDALLASYPAGKGVKGEWKPKDDGAAPPKADDKKDGAKDGAAKENKAAPAIAAVANGNAALAFQFTPAKDELNFPTPVFASHQLQGRQVVMWHPQCKIDLAQIIANPLVY